MGSVRDTLMRAPKAHWLRGVMIAGLAILHSEMAEAERLRLECSVKTECYPEIEVRGKHCTPPPVYSMLVEIDFEANTWVAFATSKDGTQTSTVSGDLKSVTQYEITLNERSYAGRTERETISRLSGAYSAIKHPVWEGIPTRVILSGSCNQTTKQLPSSKF
jgi:hypothetical protein